MSARTMKRFFIIFFHVSLSEAYSPAWRQSEMPQNGYSGIFTNSYKERSAANEPW
jgi:hypothetical protein